MHCTFAGHREILDPSIRAKLRQALTTILSEDNEFVFYFGGAGEFDRLCAHEVLAQKHRSINKSIQLVLVCPYMTKEINRDGQYLYEIYDDIIVPQELMGCHYKSAITKRNRWLVEHSQTIITYVYRDYGGAYATKRYAERKGLRIIELSRN